MPPQLRGRGPRSAVFLRDALAAVQHLEALGASDPVVLAFHPVSRTNPYQRLLYGRLWEAGIAPVPLFHLDQLDQVGTLCRLGVQVVLHLHWTAPVLQGVASAAAAEAAAAEFVARLDRLRTDGGQVAWTVHNVLPHQVVYPEIEARLRQALVDRCLLVHVLAAGTATAVAPHFRLPDERTVHIPHPNYDGAYPTVTSDAQARYELGLLPDHRVFAMIGAIRAYKGAQKLVDAFDRLVDDPQFVDDRLVLAGEVEDEGAGGFVERCLSLPFVRLFARRIMEADMEVFLRGADVIALPYHQSLNSGVALLALTFGRPLVAPDAPGIREVVDPRCARLFDPASGAEGLLAALRDAHSLIGPEGRAAARAAAGRFPPAEISRRFAVALRERLVSAGEQRVDHGAEGGQGALGPHPGDDALAGAGDQLVAQPGAGEDPAE